MELFAVAFVGFADFDPLNGTDGLELTGVEKAWEDFFEVLKPPLRLDSVKGILKLKSNFHQCHHE